MSKTKIVPILSSFEESDWKECRDYIMATSRTDNKKKKLFRYYYNHRQKWSEEVSDYGPQCKQVGAKSTKDWLNVHSDLMPLIEHFLVHQLINTQSFQHERSFLLSEAYKRKGLLSLFQLNSLDAIERLNAKGPIDLWTSLYNLRLHHSLAYSSISDTKQVLSSFGHSIALLVRLYQDLSSFYRIERYNKEKILNAEITQEDPVKQNQLAITLNHLGKMVKKEDEGSYDYLESLLFDCAGALSSELKQSLCTYLINYCYTSIKNGSMKFGPKVASLLEFSFEEKIYPGKITPTRALNLVDAVSKFKKDYDIRRDIDRIIREVAFDDQQSLRNILLASYHFCLHEYDSALDLVNHKETRLTDKYLSGSARLIKAGALCMVTDSHGSFYSFIETTKKFFKRNRIKFSVNHFKGSMNFLEALVMSKTPIEKSELLSFIDNSEYFVHALWFKRAVKNKGRPTSSS